MKLYKIFIKIVFFIFFETWTRCGINFLNLDRFKMMLVGCQFFPIGEYLKFVRVPENLARGTEILSLEAHPRSHISIMPVDKVSVYTIFLSKSLSITNPNEWYNVSFPCFTVSFKSLDISSCKIIFNNWKTKKKTC